MTCLSQYIICKCVFSILLETVCDIVTFIRTESVYLCILNDNIDIYVYLCSLNNSIDIYVYFCISCPYNIDGLLIMI